MNVLEKILEEIQDTKSKTPESRNRDYTIGYLCGLSVAEGIIRSHMNGVITNTCEKRLIDADVLDNEVMNFFLAITGDPKQATIVRECKESFRRIIDEQPTVYAGDNWIPVNERLPEDETGEVLAQDRHGEMLIGYVYYSNNMEWYECESEGEHLNDVVCWRPLPDRYKGE